MSDFLIEPLGDGDYDLVIEDDDFVIVGDTEETWQSYVAQNVIYTLGTWLGESAYDRSQGFPWEQGVFGKQPLEGIVALLYNHTLKAEGVKGLSVPPVIDVDRVSRKATISMQVDGEAFRDLDVQLVLSAGVIG